MVFDPISALITGGTGLLGAFMSSDAQSNAAQQASQSQLTMGREALDWQKDMFNRIERAGMPYQMAGYGALQQLTGVDYRHPSITGNQLGSMGMGGQGGGETSSGQDQGDLGWWMPNITPRSDGMEETNYWLWQKDKPAYGEPLADQAIYGPGQEGGLERTGGQIRENMNRYLADQQQGGAGGQGATGNALINMQQGQDGSYQPVPMPSGGIDPTGGAGAYSNALAGMDPSAGLPEMPSHELNLDYSESPGYLWQQEQMQKAINQQTAARGQYGSTSTVGVHADAQRALSADWEQLQYQREVEALNRRTNKYNMDYGRARETYGLQYNQLSDLYSKTMGLGGAQYGKTMDIIGLGTGAQGTTNNAALATGQGASNTLMNMGNAQAAGQLGKGQAQGAFWSGVGGMPNNMLSNQYYWDQLNNQNQSSRVNPTFNTPW